MADIADADLEQLRRGYALLQQLSAKPESKRELENLVKKHVNKDIVTTDELAQPYIAPLQAQIKELTDWRQSILTGQKEYDDQEQEKRLRTERSYTDDGLKAIKTFQKERNIPNLLDAADLFEARQPPKPVMHRGLAPQTWGIAEANDDSEKLLLSDPDKWATDLATSMLNDAAARRERE